eukprot:Awhi_evm2s1239
MKPVYHDPKIHSPHENTGSSPIYDKESMVQKEILFHQMYSECRESNKIHVSFDSCHKGERLSSKFIDAEIKHLSSRFVGKTFLPPSGSGSMKQAVMTVMLK